MSQSNSPDLETLQTTVTPLPPEEPESSEDQITVVWGRFWGQDFPAGGMYIKFNNTENEPKHIRMNLHADRDPLSEYDPDVEPYPFLMTLLDHDDDVGTSVSKSEESMFLETLQYYFSKPALADQLFESLEHRNVQQLQNWGKQFFQEIFKSSEFTFQLKGQMVPEGYIDDQSEQSEETQQQEEPEPRLENKPSSTEANDDEQSKSAKVIPVKFQNNPVKGYYPEDLNPSTTLLARITGEVVSQLPEQFIDDKHPDRSVPMRCTVESIDESFDLRSLGLPEDIFDWDNTEDLKAVTVEIAEGIHGVGLVHENSRLKLPDTNKTADNSAGMDYTHLLLLLLAASLLIFLYTMVG